MSPQDPSSPSPSESWEPVIGQVLARFDAYARIRNARDGILPVTRVTPQDELRAFNDLQEAVERLRDSIR
jgi:hypothetical protein